MTSRWPWPGDTPTERARRIANSLLALLPDPDDREHWRRRAHELGETWLGADLVRWEPDDIVSTEDAAHLVHVSPSAIRKWHSAGRLANVARGRYRVADVLDCAAEMRSRRVHRRDVAA